MPEKRDFESWFRTFKDGITSYEYYTKFKKVYENVDGVRDGLEKLNTLLGDKNIEEDFVSLLKESPDVLGAVSILLAIRADRGNTSIFCTDLEMGDYTYNFNPRLYTRDDMPYDMFCHFMDRTGLFDLMKNRRVSNLVDYVTGIEVGLDSNARKNRSGDLMEKRTRDWIKNAGFVLGESYFEEMYIRGIIDRWGLDMSPITNGGFPEKRFDFVVKTPSMVYGIETNFYSSGGSKPYAIAGDYIKLADCAKGVSGFTFVWFTDGKGWRGCKMLPAAYEKIDHIYNIADMENGIMKKVFV